MEADRLAIVPAPFSPRALFAEIERFFFLKVTEKGIGLRVVIDPNLPSAIILDQGRLRQILLNLVGNAVKFTDTGHVSIQATWIPGSAGGDDRAALRIAVTDTGVGIPEDECNEIFDAFYQKRGQDHAKYGGTGLGLAICKKLVTLMNGDIRVEGNPAGRGSMFTVILRVAQVANTAPEPDGAAPANEGASYEFQSACILVADDVEENRRLVRVFLRGHPFDLLEAADGEEALRIIREKKPDLLLTDIKMPRMGGIELAQAMASDPGYASVPVIAITASAMQSDLEKLTPHFRAVLPKPLSREELLGAMARLIPCRIDTIEKRLQVDEGHTAFHLDSCSCSPELRSALARLGDEYRLAGKTNQITRMKEFREKVAALATRHGESALLTWCEELDTALISFDIMRIKALTRRYEELYVRRGAPDGATHDLQQSDKAVPS